MSLIRSFATLVGLLDKGRFADACDAALGDALAELSQLPGEKGTATIAVTLTIAYDQGRIDVQPAVKSKLPEGKAFGRTPFWAHGGALSVEHPSQRDMFGPREAAPSSAKSA